METLDDKFVNMITRILYAVVMAFKHRKALQAYRHEQKLQCHSVLELDTAALQAQGVKILALDFDGVLAAHGAKEINADISNWLTRCIQSFGAGHVFILTNKPSQERAEYFANNFRDAEFIFPQRKKPYPDSILFILEKNKAKNSELLVVDDRLLTGILATVIANVRGCYITEPIVDLRARLIAELYIMGLRWFERWAI